MKRLRTPQEKKALSLELDRRNVVAESQWGGREAIAKRKQWVNQSHRKVVHQELSGLSGGVPADPEAVESAVAAAKRHNWRKQPDVPLKDALLLRRLRKLESEPQQFIQADAASRAGLTQALCTKGNWECG